MATFSERLKNLRKENNITLKQLADDLNTTKSTLSRYENNKREPKAYLIKKIANYFNVSVDYLLGITEETSTTDEFKKNILKDPELSQLINELTQRKELKTAINKLKKLNTKTIKQIIKIIETFNEDENK
ncbi:MAG: helix-turn-helix domain-containing protein [Nanoarchaeota archaeon]